jgi:poly(3-hydroxyalkanoate) depolymerase
MGSVRKLIDTDDIDDARVIDVNGVRLRVAVRVGSSARTPLLLANGIGASLETFEPLIAHLDRNLTVIRFDVPGIGGSPTPPRPYRLPALARTLGRLLDILGYPEVDVLGISWGGGLAQQFAFTERRRCRRLVLVATSPGATMVPPHPSVAAKMVTPRRYWDDQYMLRIAPDLYGGSVRTDPAPLASLVAGFTHGLHMKGYAHQMLAAWGWSSIPFLPLLRQPALVLAGDDDPLVPAANGRILARLIRRAQLHVYRGGHIELVANPKMLAPRIDRFLAEEAQASRIRTYSPRAAASGG